MVLILCISCFFMCDFNMLCNYYKSLRPKKRRDIQPNIWYHFFCLLTIQSFKSLFFLSQTPPLPSGFWNVTLRWMSFLLGTLSIKNSLLQSLLSEIVQKSFTYYKQSHFPKDLVFLAGAKTLLEKVNFFV